MNLNGQRPWHLVRILNHDFLPYVPTNSHLSKVALTRLAMRDMTLLDGTFIPKGTLVTAAAAPVHRDERYYPGADVFDPFRFARAREETGFGATQAYTHTSNKWLAFGYGKHAWYALYSWS